MCVGLQEKKKKKDQKTPPKPFPKVGERWSKKILIIQNTMS